MEYRIVYNGKERFNEFFVSGFSVYESVIDPVEAIRSLKELKKKIDDGEIDGGDGDRFVIDDENMCVGHKLQRYMSEYDRRYPN